MNLKEAIENRESVRSFKDLSVPKELILEILKNGNLAPTSGNIQPWEFIVVNNVDLKKQIVNSTYSGGDVFSSNTQKWMLGAPTFIVVCGNEEKMFEKYGDYGTNILLYLDCSACVENMLLTIIDLGLASCYVSGFRPIELSNIVNLKPHIKPIAILPIGYKAGNVARRLKIDVLSKIHYDKY